MSETTSDTTVQSGISADVADSTGSNLEAALVRRDASEDVLSLISAASADKRIGTPSL